MSMLEWPLECWAVTQEFIFLPAKPERATIQISKSPFDEFILMALIFLCFLLKKVHGI